ncbi:MAG TPA: phenylalanine--tRNA ligase subunit alpha, partial [Phycisphaerales bacterium]|nr:phenylalanine--tRNA ligase subunit alpha [Phycisphaerales bacterium]
MLELLDQIQSSALGEIEGVDSPEQLERWRIAYLGGSGRVKTAWAGFKDVPKEQKAAVGARFKSLNESLEAALERRRAMLFSSSPGATGPMIDVTEPGVVHSEGIGRRHIISRVRDELVEVFARMGFDVADGPELEDDEHNFIKLNIPPDNPA